MFNAKIDLEPVYNIGSKGEPSQVSCLGMREDFDMMGEIYTMTKETFQEFKDDWFCADNTLDDDYNHLFRFDIKNKTNEHGDEILGKFSLWMFFILQRK